MNINPDYDIEEFWLDFKRSMMNFYNDNSNVKRPIQLWSDKLNELQKNKEYSEIEINIRDYMSLYAIDLLRTYADYHIRILITNIKRWNNIANDSCRFDKSDSKYINIVFLLIDIYNTLTNKCTTTNKNIYALFSMVEIYIIHEDFRLFIDYAITNNKPGIIDKIKEFENDNNTNTSMKYIETKYNIILSPKMCAKKIIQRIESNKTI